MNFLPKAVAVLYFIVSSMFSLVRMVNKLSCELFSLLVMFINRKKMRLKKSFLSLFQSFRKNAIFFQKQKITVSKMQSSGISENM
tara:strand:+ start:70057 stop:70311 length:255 start_codon:yes stop_codon:yes gene_type:complete